jgi:hypothetical protein
MRLLHSVVPLSPRERHQDTDPPALPMFRPFGHSSVVSQYILAIVLHLLRFGFPPRAERTYKERLQIRILRPWSQSCDTASDLGHLRFFTASLASHASKTGDVRWHAIDGVHCARVKRQPLLRGETTSHYVPRSLGVRRHAIDSGRPGTGLTTQVANTSGRMRQPLFRGETTCHRRRIFRASPHSSP